MGALTGTYGRRTVSVDSVAQSGRDRKHRRTGDDGARSDTRRSWVMRRDKARIAAGTMKAGTR